MEHIFEFGEWLMMRMKLFSIDKNKIVSPSWIRKQNEKALKELDKLDVGDYIRVVVIDNVDFTAGNLGMAGKIAYDINSGVLDEKGYYIGYDEIFLLLAKKPDVFLEPDKPHKYSLYLTKYIIKVEKLRSGLL